MNETDGDSPPATAVGGSPQRGAKRRPAGVGRRQARRPGAPGLLAVARPVLRWTAQIVLALLILLEEWGWQPLADLVGRLARWRPWARAETAIARLPPYAALVVFALPSLLLLPLKFLALFLIARGQLVLAGVLFAAAKVVATALVARLFMLTRPALMQIAWFAWAYDRFIPWKDALEAYVRASYVWRVGRVWKARAKRAAAAQWRLMRPAVLRWREAGRRWRRDSPSRRGAWRGQSGRAWPRCSDRPVLVACRACGSADCRARTLPRPAASCPDYVLSDGRRGPSSHALTSGPFAQLSASSYISDLALVAKVTVNGCGDFFDCPAFRVASSILDIRPIAPALPETPTSGRLGFGATCSLILITLRQPAAPHSNHLPSFRRTSTA